MSIRPVFSARISYPYFEEIHVEMDWFQGFALSQKRKSQCSIHQNYLAAYPKEKILEVSSGSTEPLGYWLSAMHLIKSTPEGVSTVENYFQRNRIYVMLDGTQIGPFPEFSNLSGRECKRLVKEASRGLYSYKYACGDHIIYAPDYHISLFYDYVYMSGLMEEANRAVREALLSGEYTAFTDLATTSLNSQARSCAIFVGLAKAGKLDALNSIESYMELMRTNLADGTPLPGAYENTQPFRAKSKRVELLSPVVPKIFTREQSAAYFEEHYSELSNSPKYVPTLAA